MVTAVALWSALALVVGVAIGRELHQGGKQ